MVHSTGPEKHHPSPRSTRILIMYDNNNRAFVALAKHRELFLNPKMANRHGLVTGATGTGKTVTLQNLAETFSAMGVPVFAADVKGDLSGVAAVGGNKSSVVTRAHDFGLVEKGFKFRSFPVQFWDLSGESGAPVRATVAGMGALLMGRLLALNDTQSAVLTVIFKFAADKGLALVDLKDLQKTLEYAGANASTLSLAYGNLPTQSLGAIQRALVALEHQGGGYFFGEPELDIADIMRTDNGSGVINILAADKLMGNPVIYSTFLLWLLNRLFEVLPEVGDPEKPRLVFFFDEAHLLFSNPPRALLEKIEQVVRLIRSKGVGIYFISQSPADIPDSVLGQLGNRIQHALRAYTPKDQKAVKAAAASFRPNPGFDTATVISELGTGEALVSFLDEKGAPTQVERAMILPPEGQLGPLDSATRQSMTASSLIYRLYAQRIDRESAYEILNAKLASAETEKDRKLREKAEEKARKEEEKKRMAAEKEARREERDSRRFWSGMAKSIALPLVRRALGSLFKRR